MIRAFSSWSIIASTDAGSVWASAMPSRKTDATSDGRNSVAASMACRLYSKPCLRVQKKQPEQCDAPSRQESFLAMLIPILSGEVIAYVLPCKTMNTNRAFCSSCCFASVGCDSVTIDKPTGQRIDSSRTENVVGRWTDSENNIIELRLSKNQELVGGHLAWDRKHKGLQASPGFLTCERWTTKFTFS